MKMNSFSMPKLKILTKRGDKQRHLKCEGLLRRRLVRTITIDWQNEKNKKQLNGKHVKRSNLGHHSSKISSSRLKDKV